MDDREMMRLAAKAVGAEWTDYSDKTPDHWAFRHADGVLRPWSPLVDDGDALRLACVLGLTIECDFHDSDTCTAYQTRGDIVADEQAGMVGEVIGAPEFAATRRAIVRAAAAIGRAMP